MPPARVTLQRRKYLLCNGEIVEDSELHTFAAFHIIGEVVKANDRTALVPWLIHVSASRIPPIDPTPFMDRLYDGRGIACRYSGGGVVCGRSVNWYDHSKQKLEQSYEKLMRRYKGDVREEMANG